MADYQAVQESELEPAQPPATSPAPAPAGAPSNYEPVNDNDLAPAPPTGIAGQTSEFAYKGIPSAAAARFGASNAMTNIFGAAVTRAADGFANTFTTLKAQDQQTLIDHGYKPGDFNSVGGALRWGADVLGSGLNRVEDGFMAIGPVITEGAAGFGEQLSRETGIGDPERVGRELGGMAEATMADVGDMHAAAMVDAAKAQAKVPGVYSQAFRVDETPGGGLVHTPLGRLPTEAEAAAQAGVVADALHLPPEAANIIQQTYRETGRPPAEVLMDAKTNAGGVLNDIVAGKVPTAYPIHDWTGANISRETSGQEAAIQGNVSPNEPVQPLSAGTPSTPAASLPELPREVYAGMAADASADTRATAQGSLSRYIEDARKSGSSDEAIVQRLQQSGIADAPPELRQSVERDLALPPMSLETAPGRAGKTVAPPEGPIPYTPGTSKIGLSIERKAMEQGLTEGFDRTAGYDVKSVEDQKTRTLDLAINQTDDARAMIRGEKPVPDGVSPVMLIRAMENYAKQTKDGDLQYELANSPLTSGTSYAAQEMRMMQERDPDSATAKLQEIQQVNEKTAGGPKEVAARKAAVKQALPEAGKVLLPKEELSWDKFLNDIKC